MTPNEEGFTTKDNAEYYQELLENVPSKFPVKQVLLGIIIGGIGSALATVAILLLR